MQLNIKFEKDSDGNCKVISLHELWIGKYFVVVPIDTLSISVAW